MSETVDLSSDNERNPRYPPSSRATSSAYSIVASSPEVIVILDSDDDEDENCWEKLTISRALKGEPKERDEIAIKREVLTFLLFTLFPYNTHRITFHLTRYPVPVRFLSRYQKDQ